MQRNLASFDIYTIISELQSVKESYIDQIYQRGPDEVFIRLNIKNRKQKPMIYIKNEYLVTITDQKYTMPQKPTTFAMTLRKYLLNGRFTSISQSDFDRIILFNISKNIKTYTIIVELFSNGNIILTGSDNKIIYPLKTQQWSHRSIRPRLIYQPPPSQINPFKLSLNQFQQHLKKSNKDLVRTLATSLNMGGDYAEEFISRLHIDKHNDPSTLSSEYLQNLYKQFQQFLKIFQSQNFNPVIIKHNNSIIDVVPITFQKYKEQDFSLIPLESFSQGLAELIPTSSDQKNDKKLMKKQEEQAKLKRQLHQQNEMITKFKNNIKKMRHHGDLLYLHYQPVTALLTQITDTLEKKERQSLLEKINQLHLVDSFDPTANELIICLEDTDHNKHKISLDFRKTLAENANRLYNASKKNQVKLKGALQALKKTENQLIKLETEKLNDAIQKEKSFSSKNYWFERFHWCISSTGNLIIAGKDAKSNEQLVKKYLKENDRYIHADIHGAPSCIVKNSDINNQPIPITSQSLTEGCIFAASYSKAWSQFAEAQAYWVLPEQVSKTPQSGEFVPKGAFIIRGKRHYQRCQLKLALGEINIDNSKRVMCGPISALDKQVKRYIIIEPGSTNKPSIVKQIAQLLNVPITIIQGLVPSGKSDIVRT